MKINFTASPEARTEIANFIRAHASGIGCSEKMLTENGQEVAKKEIEKIRAVVKVLDILAEQIETADIK